MDVKIKGVKTGTDVLVPIKVDAAGNVFVIVCGQQADGTTTPILVDADGKIILSS